MSTPMYKKIISFENNKYIYDSITNEILKVDDCIFDIVTDYENMKTRDILLKWNNHYAVSKLENAIIEIDNYKTRGYLGVNQDIDMISPVCEECIDEIFQQDHIQITFNLTHECNMRCKYCAFSGLYKHYRKHNESVMSEDIARNALE